MAYRPTILARDWLVTAGHYLSAEAGAAFLRDGGNAFAAAAAAILVEGVVNPHMGTLGGEVVALVHDAATGVHVLNGHTRASLNLTVVHRAVVERVGHARYVASLGAERS